MRKTFTLIVIMFFMVGTLFAQTNRMSYQAVVRNANNELVYNETVSVQVEILNASGVVQYAERHTTSTNANGMLSLTIGDGTHVEGTFSNVVWQNAVIRSVFTLADGSTVTQSTPVTAVPYALYADSVDINKVYNAVADYFDHHSGSITETDPTVPEWAKAETKPTYDYSEIENTPTIPTLPTNVSAFDNDANYITAADIPTIPTVPADVSAFNNDAGYVSNALCDTVDICSLMAIINQLQVRISELEDKINSEDTTTTDPVQPTPTVIDGQPCPNAPTVVDYDGNVYNTVKIGEQCWMKENLRVKHYVGGTEIPEGTSVSYETAYRYCPNGDSTLVNTYGYLYNWKAVMHNSSSSNNNPSGIQGICPTGWHVPSVDEWEILFSPLYHQEEYTCGGGLNIAKALSDSTGWKNSTVECAIGNNVSMNNVTGFSAAPAGRYYGQYDMYQELGIYWTTAEYNTTMATNYNFVYSYGSVSPANYDKNIGMSVRCLKDDPNSANPENPTSGGTTTNGVPCPNAPTVTDVDGNTYNTIQFGTQCWMAENLRTIPINATYGVQGNTIRDAVDIGYYYYPNNSDELVSQYGLLYNWTAATGGTNDFQGTVQGVCPDGWHLPGYADYSQFRQYMDTVTYNNVANGYRCNISFSIAKSLAHASNWVESDIVCTPGNNVSTNNASGFDAPASGYVWYANYVDYNKRATFWTATEHNNDVTAGYYFGINHDKEDAYLSFDNKGNGRSVRCVRN